jgi:molybdopterin-guanine dinucleotide biosynthesis protein A
MDESSVTSSAIVLSGGESKRFKEDKGLFPVFHKPLIRYVIDAVKPLVDEVLIVTRSPDKVATYARHFPSLSILADEYASRGVLSGALTGFKNAVGEYSLLLPCDTPLISRRVLALFLDLAPGNDAVVPRWPNSYIEPLQAVYETQEAYNAARESIAAGEYRPRRLISRLNKVLYISTLVLTKLDPGLLTFHNVNTHHDLQRIKNRLKTRP